MEYVDKWNLSWVVVVLRKFSKFNARTSSLLTMVPLPGLLFLNCCNTKATMQPQCVCVCLSTPHAACSVWHAGVPQVSASDCGIYPCRHGRCIPFLTETYPSISGNRPNQCNRFYTANIDTVFLPFGRARDDLVLLNSFVATFSLNLLKQECRLVY